MARLFNHSFHGRKAVLFVAEQAAVLPAALAGAAVAASLSAGDAVGEGGAPLPRLLRALIVGPERAGAVARDIFWALADGAAARLDTALPWALGATLGCAASLYAADLYNLRFAAADRRSGGRRTLLALAIAAVALAVAAAPSDVIGRGAALGAALAAAGAVVTLRIALPAIVGRPARVLVVGTGPRAAAVIRAIASDAEASLEVAGIYEPGADAAEPEGRSQTQRPLFARSACPSGGPATGRIDGRTGLAPEGRSQTKRPSFARGAYPIDGPASDRGGFRTGLGNPGGLLAAARRAEADRIVVALEDGRGHLAGDELVRCRLAGIPCLTPAMLYEQALRRIPVDALRPSELAFSDGFRMSRGREVAKRTLDLGVAVVGLVLAAPVLLAAVLAVRLGSRGPAFYRQERVGRHGRVFTITKLRTMRLDAEAAGAPRWAEERDPRVTAVGRFLRLTRIDEIPQILSVLAGDMSFVGPRPERPYFVERLEQQIPWYSLREAARPGLTGWAQLRYPYGASVDDARVKLEYDLYYIKNGSIFLDISILFHTVRHVLTGRGAR